MSDEQFRETIDIDLGKDVFLSLKVTDRFDDAVRKALHIPTGQKIEKREYRQFLALIAQSTVDRLDVHKAENEGL